MRLKEGEMIKTVAKYERAPSSLYRIWPESGWRHHLTQRFQWRRIAPIPPRINQDLPSSDYRLPVHVESADAQDNVPLEGILLNDFWSLRGKLTSIETPLNQVINANLTLFDGSSPFHSIQNNSK